MPEIQDHSRPVVDLARENTEFRKVPWTGDKTQPVLLAIPEGGEIGGKVHEGHDQLLYFATGRGLAKIGETESEVSDGDVSIVPSGVFHDFRHTGSEILKLFTTDSPPEHDPGTEHATKAEAEADDWSSVDSHGASSPLTGTRCCCYKGAPAYQKKRWGGGPTSEPSVLKVS